MHQRARADANQPEIVAHFRKRGATVQHVHQIPGALDLIIGYAGIDVRIEIKDGSKPSSASIDWQQSPLKSLHAQIGSALIWIVYEGLGEYHL